ncbi:MAG TPA: LON peptidase substrate-binding domain-containing protein [Gemmatimonadales bacterium]|nr:LON peptidase substrate-binding domain-containing protein [Gemmatimonadales bacterium]
MSTQLPLFPLRLVLFPHALLPLHIFEPRYRQLLADLTGLPAERRLFGILPPGEAVELPEPGTVGCAARLRGAQRLPDGRANVVVSGERRFVFRAATPAPTPYHQGLVDWLDDEPDVQVPSEAETALLHHLGERYVRAQHALQDRAIDVDLPREAPALSFAIAAFLEWDLGALQHFLEIRSASVRVTRLLAALPTLVASAEARAATHTRAQSNGHGSVA